MIARSRSASEAYREGMRIVIIGGSGHIGTFLVPRLVRGGHEVVNVARGQRAPYAESPEWQQVEQVVIDREQADRDGTFAEQVLALRPQVVVDLVCFTLESATALVEGLRGKVEHLVHCGSIWRAGVSHVVPIDETNATEPFGDYGVGKDRIARMLREETASGGLVTTSLHPGHISGPGWAPIGPTGNLDQSVWTKLAAGEPVLIPSVGAETMAHVHADDVAQAFELAVEHRDRAAGEDFFITARDALNVRGYAELAASWFGQRANLQEVGWPDFRASLSDSDAETSWQHLVRSQAFSIEKAASVLGYQPAYTAGETVLDAVRWLVQHREVETGALVV
jgi:nucleoside-diphosphate-sugar epimerase